uniref:Uncharacterized protein n=1 Tax=Anopheles minimus TaxID=112268 RepID=A0A182VW65_9DIPT
MALDQVHITHYINPHCFYYKPETAYMQEHEQAKFAATFHEYCEKEYGKIYDTVRNVHSGKLPQPGDLVAMRSNQLQRWIRCEVEELIVDLNQTRWYYLWAIDEGIPIKSNPKYVKPLPQAFGQESPHAKRGAIINILPGEMQFNYREDEYMLVPTTKWSTGITNTLELILENAENISFSPTNQFLLQNETIHVGELFITTHANKTRCVAKMLQEACPGQLIETESAKFCEAINYLQALDKKRYVNNAGFDNHVVNTFVNQYLHENNDLNGSIDSQTDTKVAMKVYEWLHRNKEARIAILEQQNADKDRVKEPTVTNDSTESLSHTNRGKNETDEKEGTTLTIDPSFQCKPSQLIKNIKRHQARMRQMKQTGA